MKTTDMRNTPAPTETIESAAGSPSDPMPAPEARATAGNSAPGGEPLAIPQTLTAEQIEELTARAAKAEENWDRYVRAVAELDNYRKRVARERTEALQFAHEGLVRKLLPVLDNFEAALAAADPAGNLEAFKTGVHMIHNQLRQVLAEAGVEEINAAGQPFDPNLHEAVAQHPSSTVPEGHVLQQKRRGYRLHGRLLRPASVIVAQSETPAS